MNLNVKNLYYRRQFILSSLPIEMQKNWKKVKLNESLNLTCHPDLECIDVKKGDIRLILLGFILNPYDPGLSNRQILEKLVSSITCFEELIKGVYSLAGRWVLIFISPSQFKIIHDAAGMRQVFYSFYNDQYVLASQPHVIATQLNLKRDKNQDILQFLNTLSTSNMEKRWIGDGTPYENVFHLLPNHYLDLKNKTCPRYFPEKNLEPIDLDTAIPIVCELLKGIITAISQRSNLTMAITGGWDSRTILSACKNIKNDIYFYIQKYQGMTDRHLDIKIPRKLLKQLGLKFHIHDCNHYDNNSEFFEIIKKNCFMLQTEKKLPLYYDFFSNFKHDQVNLSGVVAEMCRRPYGYGVFTPVIPEKLAARHGFENDPYVTEVLKNWIDDLPDFLSEDFALVLDFMENSIGNWGAMFPTELDIALEEFYPFNCRELLCTCFSVDNQYKGKKESQLFRGIIQNLWPELLRAQFNIDFKTQILCKVKRIRNIFFHPLKSIKQAIKV